MNKYLHCSFNAAFSMMLSSAIHRYEITELYGIDVDAPEFHDAVR